MKTNIIKYEVDKVKLQEEISKYETINDNEAHLFMNEDTMNAIASDIVKKCIPIVSSCCETKELGKLDVYHDNKCFINNDLAFGEVEIR